MDPVVNIPYKLLGDISCPRYLNSILFLPANASINGDDEGWLCAWGMPRCYKVPWSYWHELFHSRHLSILMLVLCQPGPSHLQIPNPIFRSPPSRLCLDDAPYLWAHNILSTSPASFPFVWCPSSTPPPFIPIWLVPSTTPLLASCLCWYSQNARLLVRFSARNFSLRALFSLTIYMPRGVVVRFGFFFTLGGKDYDRRI